MQESVQDVTSLLQLLINIRSRFEAP